MQYIALRKDVEIRDAPGRHTRFVKGTHGVLVDETSIMKIQKLLRAERDLYLKRAIYAKDQGLVLALLAGYMLELDKEAFDKINDSNFCIDEILLAGS